MCQFKVHPSPLILKIQLGFLSSGIFQTFQFPYEENISGKLLYNKETIFFCKLPVCIVSYKAI